MSINVDGPCIVHCDGRLENGRPCNHFYAVSVYKSREEVVLSAINQGGYTENAKTGQHFCRRCSQNRQQ